MPRLSFRARGQLLHVDLPDSDAGWKHQHGYSLLAKTGSSVQGLQEVFVKRFKSAVPAGHDLLLGSINEAIPNTAQLLHYRSENGFHYYVLVALRSFKDLSYYLASSGDLTKLVTVGSTQALISHLCSTLYEINRRGFYHPDVCFRNIMVRFRRGESPNFAVVDLDSCRSMRSKLPPGTVVDPTWWSLFLSERLQNAANLNPSMILGMALVFLRALVEIRRGTAREKIREILLGRPDDQRALFSMWDRGDPREVVDALRPFTVERDRIANLLGWWCEILVAMRAGGAASWDQVRSFVLDLLSLVAEPDDIWLGTSRNSSRYRAEQERVLALAEVWKCEGRLKGWRAQQRDRLQRIKRWLKGVGGEAPWLALEGDLLVEPARFSSKRPDLSTTQAESALSKLERWNEGIPLGESFDGPVYGLRLCFSPDGAILVIGGRLLWDVQNGCKLLTLSTPWDSAVAFSPDSRFMAVAYESGTVTGSAAAHHDHVVETWNIPARKRLRKTVLEKVGPCYDCSSSVHLKDVMAISQDGCTFAETSRNRGSVTLWNLLTGKRVRRIQPALFRRLVFGDFMANALAFSSDGTLLAGGGYRQLWGWDNQRNRTAFIVDVKGKKREWGNSVGVVVCSPDSRWLAALTDGREVRLVDARTGGEIWSRSYDQFYSQLAFSPSGRELVVGGSHIRTLDAASGTERWSVKFQRDAALLVGAPADPVGRVVAATDGQIVTAAVSSRIQLEDQKRSRESLFLHTLSAGQNTVAEFESAASAVARQVASDQEKLDTELGSARRKLAEAEGQRISEVERAKSEADAGRMHWHTVEARARAVGGGGASSSLYESLRDPASGTTVRLAPGLYVLERNVNLTNKDLILMGSGPDSTVIVVRGVDHGFYVGEGATCRLKDLTLRYEGDAGDLIWCSSGSLVVEGCLIMGAIQRDGKHGNGLAVYTTGRARLIESAFLSNADDGVWVLDDGEVTIERCYLAFNKNGLELSKQASGRIVESICAENTQYGLLITTTGDLAIEKNVYLRNGSYGIGVGGTSMPIICDNTCEDNATGGIGFWSNASGVARHNICSRNDYGIVVMGQARPTIEGNICTGNQHDGIRYQSSASGVATGNMCLENGAYGIAACGDSHPNFERNLCHANPQSGIGFWSAAKGTSTGNQCIRNKGSGIIVMENAGPILENSECAYNEHSGIRFADSTSGAARFNHCVGNGAGGISKTEAAKPILEGNISG